MIFHRAMALVCETKNPVSHALPEQLRSNYDQARDPHTMRHLSLQFRRIRIIITLLQEEP